MICISKKCFFFSHLLKSIAFAPSLSFNAYPSIPMAVRTQDRSASVSASSNACSYAEGKRAMFVSQILILMLIEKEKIQS